MARRYGRAQGGEAESRRPPQPLENDDLRRRPPARRPRRANVFDGPINALTFEAYVEQFIVPLSSRLATSSSWTTCPATSGRRWEGGALARASSTIRPTALTSIRSKSCSSNSKPCYEKPPSGPWEPPLEGAIAKCLDKFTPREWANYFEAAGYGANLSGTSSRARPRKARDEDTEGGNQHADKSLINRRLSLRSQRCAAMAFPRRRPSRRSGRSTAPHLLTANIRD